MREQQLSVVKVEGLSKKQSNWWRNKQVIIACVVVECVIDEHTHDASLSTIKNGKVHYALDSLAFSKFSFDR